MGKESLIVTQEMVEAARNGNEKVNELIYESVVAFIHSKIHYWGRKFFGANYHGGYKDELLSVALEAYWQCVRKFDPSMGIKFITPLGDFIDRGVLKYFNRYHKKHYLDHPTVSFDKIIEHGDDTGTETWVARLLGGEDQGFGAVESQGFIDIIQGFEGDPKHGNLIPYILNGVPQYRIAKKLGICQVQVSRIWNKQRVQLQQILIDKGMVDPDIKRAISSNPKRCKPKVKKSYTESQKIDILKHLDSGLSVRQIFEMFGIPETTIRSWDRNRHKLKTAVSL